MLLYNVWLYATIFFVDGLVNSRWIFSLVFAVFCVTYELTMLEEGNYTMILYSNLCYMMTLTALKLYVATFSASTTWYITLHYATWQHPMFCHAIPYLQPWYIPHVHFLSKVFFAEDGKMSCTNSIEIFHQKWR